MIVDSSVLVALALDEQDAPLYREKLSGAEVFKVSAVSLAEASVVMLQRFGLPGALLIEEMVMAFGMEVEPFTEDQALFALEAYARFGKGQNSRAKLNLRLRDIRTCEADRGAAAV